MGEGNSGILYEKETRKALGDMTNRIGKRKFQSISKSSITLGTDIEYDTNFLKQVAMAVEKFEKENNIQKFPKLSNEIKLSLSKGGEKSRLLNPSIDPRKDLLNARKDMKENSNSVLDRINLGAGNEGEKLKEGGVSGVKISENLKCIERVCVDGEEAVVVSDVAENEGSYEVLGTQIVSDSAGNQSVDCLANSKCDMNLNSNSKLVESQEMQGFGLERCKLLKRDVECIDSNPIKDCSCSFCSKAAFIWSDLHYQDAKGRVAALTKIQKEASNLSQKYAAENVKGGHSSGNISTAAQLEIDLSHQWSSLFLHMVDTYRTEGSQLENNFLALKEIRGDYKMNLEINGMPVDVVQCSSDASEL